MQLSRFTAALLLSAAAFLPLPASAQSQPASNRILRVAPHADLKTLDPVAASIVITRMHGLMIYETLFAWIRTSSRSRRWSRASRPRRTS